MQYPTQIIVCSTDSTCTVHYQYNNRGLEVHKVVLDITSLSSQAPLTIGSGFTQSSYNMIVLYSRDHKGVGVAHEITPPKNQPQSSLMMMRQYWLGKTKPKQAFRSTRNAFNKLLWNLKKI